MSPKFPPRPIHNPPPPSSSPQIIKCVRDYRHSLRHRLSWRALRRLPQQKFKEGDPYEVCAICLDDYEVGDKLRILPCKHGESSL